METTLRADRETAADVLRPLAPAGFVTLAILAGFVISPASGEAHEWNQYLILGACSPVTIALALAAGDARRPSGWRVLELTLGAVALVALVAFVVILRRPVAFTGCLLQLAALWMVDGGVLRRSSRSGLGAIVLLSISLAAWTAASALVATSARGVIALQGYAAAVSRDFVLAFPICLLLTTAGLSRRPTRRMRFFPLLFLVALVTIGLASLRTDPAFAITAIPHWGLFVGPANLVRQGGWLLWDVPSTYGFLLTLAIAYMPTHSAWDGLFLLNALLLFAAGMLLFVQFRALGTGWWNAVLSLALALSAVFWLPGLAALDGWSATATTPSYGPLRTIWCLLLLAVVRGIAARERVGDRSTWLVVIGSLLWVVGALWSFESAVYCSAVWLPAYAVVAWRSAHGRREPSISRLLILLCVPPVLAGLAAGAIWAWYVARLGHAPDWYSFVEYAEATRSGWGALPINPLGAVWILLFVFGALCAALAASVRKPGVVLLLATLGAVWSTSSYFVWRSHEIVVTSAMPLLLMAMAMALETLRRDGASETVGCYVEIVFTPIVVAALVLALGSGRWSSASAFEVHNRYGLSVDAKVAAKPGLVSALLAGSVRQTDPIVFCEWHLTNWRRLAGWEGADAGRAWLPTVPFSAFRPLAEDRRRVYMQRFIEKVHASGWLLQSSAARFEPESWFLDQLKRTHRPTRRFEVGGLKMTWFEIVEPGLAK